MLLQGHPPPLIVVVAASCAALGSALTYLYLSRATRRKIEDEALPYSLETKHNLPNVLYRNLASPVGFSRPDPYNPQGRTGYLSWDDYFMAVAFLSAERSKDPNKQVGACIVNKDKVILGIGYNGFPRGCADNKLPWAKKSRTEGILGTKYPYVVHAEANALLNTNSANVHNASIYVTMFPCNECAKLLIQAGIKEVIYHEDKFEGRVLPSVDSKEDESSQGLPDPCYVASKRMLTMAGVKLIQHKLEKTIVVPPVQHGQGCWTGCSAQQDGCSDLNPLDVAMVVAPSCSLPRKH